MKLVAASRSRYLLGLRHHKSDFQPHPQRLPVPLPHPRPWGSCCWATSKVEFCGSGAPAPTVTTDTGAAGSKTALWRQRMWAWTPRKAPRSLPFARKRASRPKFKKGFFGGCRCKERHEKRGWRQPQLSSALPPPQPHRGHPPPPTSASRAGHHRRRHSYRPTSWHVICVPSFAGGSCSAGDQTRGRKKSRGAHCNRRTPLPSGARDLLLAQVCPRGWAWGRGPEFCLREGWWGGLEPKSPKICVPKTAQIKISFCKFHFFPP